MGRKIEDTPELVTAPENNDEFYVLDNSEPSGERGKRVKFDKISEGALAPHVDGAPSKHNADQIDYQRDDASKKDIRDLADTVEDALSDLDDSKLSRTGNQAMTGNLDAGSNDIVNVDRVDGRDVSVDGANLDNHLASGPGKHVANNIQYQRADADKNDIQTSSDDMETAVTDLDNNKLSRTGNQAMTGNLNVGGNNVTNVGTVDGRDVSVDGSALDNHLASGINKHVATSIAYERNDADKKDIETGSDTIEEAVTNLDDRKLSRTGSQAMTGNLDMGTNNVTNVGTVDGRNVSVDGVKLDTIEVNATADQSATEVPYDNTNTIYTATDVSGALSQTSRIIQKDNVLIVSKQPGVGEFSSVKAAVDSITTASQNNPYAVKVRAGVYIEDTIVLKPHIAILGDDDHVSILQSSDISQPLIIGSDRAEIKNLQLRGSTATGVPLVYHQGTSPSISPFSVIGCAFGAGNILIKVEGNALPTVVRIEGCRTIAGEFFAKALEVSRTGTGETLAFVSNFIYQKIIAPFPEVIFDISNGARLIVDTSLIEVDSATTDGFTVHNGGIIDIVYCAIVGMNRALYVPNVGAPPVITTSDLVIVDCLQDILIEHPGTTGNFSGIANTNKVNIDPAAAMAVAYRDNANGGMSASGAVRLGRRQDVLVDVLDLIESSPTLGVIAGGELTDGGGLNVNVSAGLGYIAVVPFPEHELRRLDWPDQSIAIASNQDVYVYFNTLGILTASPSRPDTTRNILLGRVRSNGSSIDFIENTPMNNHHYGNQLDRLIREAFGPIYATGSIVEESTSNSLKINVTDGVYFYSGNRLTPSGGTEIEFAQSYKDGASGEVISTTDTVNNTHYDDGSGTLQPLTAGYFARHDLYIVGTGVGKRYHLVMSQFEHDSLAAAETAPTNTPPTFMRDAAVRIASLIVQEGQSNINTVIDVRPTLGFSAEAVSAGSNHSNLTGLLNDDHPQYLLINGNRNMAGSLNMGSNNITDVNLVDGVDVSSHQSRHLPNGADPLTTAAPATTLSGATTNSVGIANSLSRSDHTHAIASATTSISGLMSAPDKVKLNTIETNAKDDQNASEVPYDNTTSDLAATNVQAAVDELDSRLDSVDGDTTDHLDGGPSKHSADQVDYERNDIDKVDIQAASNDVESALTDLDNNKISRSGVQAMTGNLDMGTNSISNVNLVDGRDVSSDGAKLDTIETNAKDDQQASEVPYSNATSDLAATNVQAAVDELDGRLDTAETDISNLQSDKQDISEKGQPDGYASLDSAGKIPTTQLPTKMMEFEGNWDASTNTPTLSNTDTGLQGTVYRVTAPGTVDFGSGPIDFDTGDWVYNTGNTWERGDNIDKVTSIFGREGDVVAQSGDYNASQIDYTPDELTDWTAGFDPGQTSDAIDQLASRLTADEQNLANHLDGGPSKHDASEIDYERADINRVDIQAASDDAESALSDLDDNKLSRTGSQAMTGNLDMGTNNVTNVGTVDGVVVSAHASRHNPAGADPLATAAPVTLNPNQTNMQGTANSYSRSDHVHNVPAASAVTSSSDANTQGTSSSFARADHTHKITQNTPAAGQLVRWNGTNWVAYSPTVSYQEDETTQTTTSTAFQQAFRANFTIPETGNYFLEWYLEIWNETSARATQARVELNDATVIGVHTQFVDDSRFATPIARWTSGAGMKRINLTAGSHFVDFDFRSSEAGRVSNIRFKRLVVKRLE
jgi:hypothetical protein